MYMMMSFSGSSDSRIHNCAINRFATLSSTGVPRKMMRSFARREYGSHSIRPRGVSWMNRGTGTYLLRILTPRTPSFLLFRAGVHDRADDHGRAGDRVRVRDSEV